MNARTSPEKKVVPGEGGGGALLYNRHTNPPSPSRITGTEYAAIRDVRRWKVGAGGLFWVHLHTYPRAHRFFSVHFHVLAEGLAWAALAG